MVVAGRQHQRAGVAAARVCSLPEAGGESVLCFRWAEAVALRALKGLVEPRLRLAAEGRDDLLEYFVNTCSLMTRRSVIDVR